MIGMKINKLRVDLNTSEGDYGFECGFKAGLNIVRGNNSSGKSTLVNSIIYALGMEEILGGKGEKVLPYALKDYVENESKDQVKIASSYVYIEVCNHKGEVVTLKRPVRSSSKDTKLIEVVKGGYITTPEGSYEVVPMFLHDKGSAQHEETGFFSFLEKFVGFKLPNVAGTNGGEAKLYLQTIFSAMFVEQKRGWTDYIANTPYYAIRDVRTKVVEFLLGFDVFENDRKKASIVSGISDIQSQWAEERVKVRIIEDGQSITVSGVKPAADDAFDSNLVKKFKEVDGEFLDLNDYISKLVRKVEALEASENGVKDDVSLDVVVAYQEAKESLDQLVYLLDSANKEASLAKTRLSEYRSAKIDIEKDLEKNKIASKLKAFGAEKEFSFASDSCPTCHQYIDDSLFLADTLVQPMSMEENIKYLESQKQMLTKYIYGIERNITGLESQSRDLAEKVAEKRAICLSKKKEVRASGSVTESDLRLKLQLESKIERLMRAEKEIDDSCSIFEILKENFKRLKSELAAMPERKASKSDFRKHSVFQSRFREYADFFGYKSAPISDVEINKDTLFPYLSGLELREVNTDIKSDSSASDFVRLIWAYLLSIFSTSASLGGNHVGLVILDEPGQHSMAVKSVNSLLRKASELTGLQSIVAASFDESDEVFEESVAGVDYNLVDCGFKLLRPVSS